MLKKFSVILTVHYLTMDAHLAVGFFYLFNNPGISPGQAFLECVARFPAHGLDALFVQYPGLNTDRTFDMIDFDLFTGYLDCCVNQLVDSDQLR